MKITGKTIRKIGSAIKRSTTSAAKVIPNLFSGIHGNTTARGRRLSSTLQADPPTGGGRVTWGKNQEKTYAPVPLKEREKTSGASTIREDRAQKQSNHSSKTSDKNPKKPPQPTQSLPMDAGDAAPRVSAVPVSGNQPSPQSAPAEVDPEVNALLALVADVPDDAVKRLLDGGKATASAPFTPARPVFSGTEKNLEDVAYRAPTNDSNFDSGIRGQLYQTLTARTSGPAAPEGKLHSVEYRIKGKDGDNLNSACVDIATLKRELGSVSALRFSEKSSTNFALSMVNHLNSSKESPLVPISTENLTVSWAIEKNSSGALSASYRISTGDSGVVIEGDITFPDQSKSIGLPAIQAPFDMWKAGRAQAATQLPSTMLVSDVTQPKYVATRVAHVTAQEAKPIASRGVKLDDDDLTSLAAKGRSTSLPPFHGVPIVAHEQPLAIDAQEALAEFKAMPHPGAQRQPVAPSTPSLAVQRLSDAEWAKNRKPIPENHRAPRKLPAPTVAAEPVENYVLSSIKRAVGMDKPSYNRHNLLPAPLREGISKTNAARLVDLLLKDPDTRTGPEKKFLAKHQQLVDQFECAGMFGARTRNLRSYLEGARTVHAKEIPNDQLVGNRAAELRLSIPAVFRSNISNTKDDLAFVSAVQYSPVKDWRDEDWGHIKQKAQAYEDTGRSLSDYMAWVKAELDKLKAG